MVFTLGSVAKVAAATLIILSILYVLLGDQWQNTSFNSVETISTPAETQIIEDVIKAAPESFTSEITLLTNPPTKYLGGGTQVFQTFNNCGPASLSMLLSHYGITQSQAELGRQLRPYQHPQGDNDDKSVTLEELALKASEFGFTTYHQPAGSIDILKSFIAQDMPVLTRTWLELGEDIGHYRVVIGYDDETQEIIQNDSLQGKNLRYTYAEFLDLWQAFNYEFLVLVPEGKQEVATQILAGRQDTTHAWEVALDFATQQINDNPNDMYAYFNQSVALYYLGRYAESATAYEQVASRLPRRMLWYQLEPVMAYYHLDNDQKVLAISQQILDDENRAYSELYYLRGLVLQRRGDTAAATASFQQADHYNSSPYWKVNVEAR